MTWLPPRPPRPRLDARPPGALRPDHWERTGNRDLAGQSLGFAEDLAVAALPAAVLQGSVEAFAEGRIARTPPQQMALVELDRTSSRGPAPTGQTQAVALAGGGLLPDPSCEQKESFWALGSGDCEARWATTQVYSGKVAADLSCTGRTLSLLTTNARARHEAPSGAFPAAPAKPGVFARNRGIAPALRLWTYHKPQTTHVDQVGVRRLR